MTTPLHLVPFDPAQDAAEAALEAEILAGFGDRHLAANHKVGTVATETAAARQFGTYTGRRMWDWRAADMDAFSADLVRRKYAVATIRGKQGVVRRLLEHAGDDAYDYNDRCFALTGKRIPQICSRANTIRHLHGPETNKRRNFTADERKRFFATADERIGLALRACDRRSRQMHYTLFIVYLATGERAFELVMTDVEDLILRYTDDFASFTDFEGALVRFGKSSNGSPPKWRTVPALAIFACAWQTLSWYLEHVRPHLVKPNSPPAVFLNSRGGRLRSDTASATFKTIRELAGLSDDLTLHCMRHTFQTMVHEGGIPPSLSSKFMGHASQITTETIYDHLASSFIKERVHAYNMRLLARSDRCASTGP